MTTEPDEPTVIIPTRACWASHAKRAHLPHIFGTPPNVWRCTGTVHAPCDDFGTAIVQRTPDGPRWQLAESTVHISPDLLIDEAAVEFIETKYRLAERCPVSDAIHAYLKEPV